MARIAIVTGAAGFIGSHAAEEFVRRGFHVVGIDNFSPYYDQEQKRRNLAEVEQTARSSDTGSFGFHEGDIRDRAFLTQLFESCTPDVVVHLAAMPGVGASVVEPWLYYDVNHTGTLNLLDCARVHGKPRFIFASTSSVYGATTRIPFQEDDAADHPLAPYPASKRACELLGHAYHHLHGIDFCALRFFTVYGPRGRPDMFAFQAVDRMHRGLPLRVYGRGDLKRDWTFVEDIAEGIVEAAEQSRGYQVVNLGRGEPVSVLELVRTLERLSGLTAEINYQQAPSSDMPATFANISKARAHFGYAPRTSVEAGAAALLRWYRGSPALRPPRTHAASGVHHALADDVVHAALPPTASVGKRQRPS
ncbi:MAG: NAD-dependent epimerase/dehydratase [Myxococcaceae bacterium]|nr:NAD-dependent epimerase/dehydratase [Myxococcaceae bacterium]